MMYVQPSWLSVTFFQYKHCYLELKFFLAVLEYQGFKIPYSLMIKGNFLYFYFYANDEFQYFSSVVHI